MNEFVVLADSNFKGALYAFDEKAIFVDESPFSDGKEFYGFLHHIKTKLNFKELGALRGAMTAVKVRSSNHEV